MRLMVVLRQPRLPRLWRFRAAVGAGGRWQPHDSRPLGHQGNPRGRSAFFGLWGAGHGFSPRSRSAAPWQKEAQEASEQARFDLFCRAAGSEGPCPSAYGASQGPRGAAGYFLDRFSDGASSAPVARGAAATHRGGPSPPPRGKRLPTFPKMTSVIRFVSTSRVLFPPPSLPPPPFKPSSIVAPRHASRPSQGGLSCEVPK